MKIVKYRAGATGVTWYAIRNKTHITPWCMSLSRAFRCWFKGDMSPLTGWDRKVTKVTKWINL